MVEIKSFKFGFGQGCHVSTAPSHVLQGSIDCHGSHYFQETRKAWTRCIIIMYRSTMNRDPRKWWKGIDNLRRVPLSSRWSIHQQNMPIIPYICTLKLTCLLHDSLRMKHQNQRHNNPHRYRIQDINNYLMRNNNPATSLEIFRRSHNTSDKQQHGRDFNSNKNTLPSKPHNNASQSKPVMHIATGKDKSCHGDKLC